MTLFYLYLCGISLLALSMLIPALFGKRLPFSPDRSQRNVEIARERLKELEDSADEESRNEVKQNLHADMETDTGVQYRRISPIWGAIIVLMVPIAGLGLYWQLGNPSMVNFEPAGSNQHNMDIDTLIVQLESRLEQAPGDIQGWRLASRTYMSLNQYEKAEQAFRRLDALEPGNATTLAGLADALIMRSGNVYTDEARGMVERSLAIDPQNINALWLAGLGASSLGEYQEAENYLEQLKDLLADSPESQQQVDMMLQRNRTMMESENQSVTPAAVSGNTLEIQVEMDAALKANLPDTSVLFVFAKAVDGPPMPLAVSRTNLQHLKFPVKIVLDETMAMVPGMSIADFDSIKVQARVSLSGLAEPSTGDYVSPERIVIKENASGELSLKIDSVLK